MDDRSAGPAMRLALIAIVLLGCARQHPLDLEIRAPDGGVSSLSAIEVRVYRVGADAGCPPMEDVAAARDVAPVASAQSFSIADGRGGVIGEIPPGRWAITALARDSVCTATLAGCAIVDVGPMAMTPIVVELAPHDPLIGCGTCRTCEEGACTPFDAVCP
jgi:hypothetical protein